MHPKFQTPSFATIITGLVVGIPSLFVDIAIVTDLTSIGTLFAFVLVCAGVLNLPAGRNARARNLSLTIHQWCVDLFAIVPGVHLLLC
ncbi:MAG: hypothetical protein WDO15_23295 [Bacteroidota bacterium]